MARDILLGYGYFKKSDMRKILILSAVIAFFGFREANKLIGRWESKPSPKGNVTGVVFKADNSFEGYINKKPFTSGTYTWKDNILSFVDNGCDGQHAEYKTIFFSNEDSLRFEPISDSCMERKNGMSRTVLGRIK
jgi:hypothetical protein